MAVRPHSDTCLDAVETAPREELARLQGERLSATVERALHAPFYKQQFATAGITLARITRAEDIAACPFTDKQDLRDGYPWGHVAVSRDELVRLHASSGTTGAATAVYYTQADVDAWAHLMARSLYCAGVRAHHIFQNMAGYGLFTGGLGVHYGAERLGCLTVPSGPGNTKRQVKLIRDFGVSTLHIIPSYALYFAEWLVANGVNPRELPLEIALIGAEPHIEETRRRIEDSLHLRAYNSYGLSEMNGPGVAFECEHQSGMHIWEDAYIVEVLDPVTLAPVPDGEVGELVLTTLGRTGMPLLRYRTRDLTRIIPGQCACGRTMRRIDRIQGRSDDMLIIKGVNIFPMQIEHVLMGVPEVGSNYVIKLTREGSMDQIRVLVEIRDESFVEDMRVLTGLQKRIAGLLRDEILVTPRVELVQNGSLARAEGKAVRVLDEREPSE